MAVQNVVASSNASVTEDLSKVVRKLMTPWVQERLHVVYISSCFQALGVGCFAKIGVAVDFHVAAVIDGRVWRPDDKAETVSRYGTTTSPQFPVNLS